jgi:hypothetical protein
MVFVILVCTIWVFGGCSYSRKVDDMKNDSLIHEFKNDTGFFDLPEANDRVGVVLNWDELLDRVPSIGRNWKDIEASQASVVPGSVSKSWMLLDGEKRASIEVCVTSSASVAREKVVQLASQTMALKSPFKRLKTGLGEFALGNLNSEYEKMMWCRANVVVTIYIQPANLHGFAIGVAHEIDLLMKEKQVADITANLPSFPNLSLTKTVLKIGDQVQIAPDWRSDESELYLVDPSMAFSEREPRVLVAEREGRYKIFAMIVNKKNLLHRQEEISLQVVLRSQQ